MLRRKLDLRICRQLALTVGVVSTGAVLAGPKLPLAYPPAHKCDQVDEYHGVKVNDPYRWLEDVDSQETHAWIAAQNEVTFAYLEQIPARDKINERLTELWDYEKYGVPVKHGGRYFYTKNDGLQNQSVLYWTPALEAEPRVLFDPNLLAEDGTIAASGYAISEDGKRLAYGLSASGSDWQEWKVRNVDTGEDLDDHLKWVKFSSASWTKDGAGFYYGRYDEPDQSELMQKTNYFQKLYYHRVGTPQSDDKLVYHRPDQKDWMFSGSVTDDGRYLIISIDRGSDNKYLIFYKDLQADDAPVVELISKFEAEYAFIDNDGPVFWFRTDLDAPRGRVVAIDTRKPQRENWNELIPESGDALRHVTAVGGSFVASYLSDARSRVKVFGTEGKIIREAELPGIGTASGFSGKRDDPETFYFYTSFPVIRWDLMPPERFASLLTKLNASRRPFYAVLFQFEHEDVRWERLPAAWEKIAMVDGVGIWRLDPDASLDAVSPPRP